MLYARIYNCLNRSSNITSKVVQSIPNLRTRFKSIETKIVCTMNEAYFRYEETNDVFDVTFRYVNPELNVDRQFNFSRKSTETVSNFLRRIDTNLEKALSKKIKKKKLKKGETKDDNEITDEISESVILSNGVTVDGESTCGSVFQENTDVKLVILGVEYTVRLNFPWIGDINLPNSILAGFPVYPSKFESVYTAISDSEFTWYKDVDSVQPYASGKDTAGWEEVGKGYLYTPVATDVGRKLKLRCLPGKDGRFGPSAEAESASKVEAGPGLCPFETRHLFTTERLSGRDFRVTSYNILADLYTDSDYTRETLFPYCPPYALAIDYRKQLFLKELIGYNSDIICLQEVDQKIFYADLEPTLSMLNYDGVFNRKGGTVSEGLATFFNRQRFHKLNFASVIMSKNVKLGDFGPVWGRITNEKTKERFLERANAVQATTLQSIDNPSEILVIGNTHLYFHPDADHIRLLQGYYSLSYVRSMAEVARKEYPSKNVSVLLCGDFNSVPECGIYQLMTKKYVPEGYKDWSSNPEEIVENVSLSQDLSLASACGTPQYTNFTSGFADCLDYIFYQTDRLEVTQVIPMPSNEELTLHTALPSVVFPSDHVSICADLKWTV